MKMELARVPSVRDDSYGILTLSEGQEPVADIVVVHGLGGHRLQTWTHRNGCLWIRDLLPHDMPHARIMTFGYDASWKRSTSNTLSDSGILLLSHLSLERDRDVSQNRPLVFVCHSLGGLVVKKALIQASRLEQYLEIRRSTVGVIFMGTPHRGSPLASVGKSLINAIKFAFNLSTSHIKSLVSDSEELREIAYEFGSIVTNPPLKVINFVESSTYNVGPIRLPIVPRASGSMDPIGPVQHPIPLDGDHRTMCQFPGKQSSQYKLVKGTINSLITTPDSNPPKVVDVHGILTWLQFQNPTFPQPTKGTCQWIFNLDLFQKFLADEKALLWIHGPPGIGKSTLSFYVSQRLRIESRALVVHSAASALEEKRRGIPGFICNLLGQILQESGDRNSILHFLKDLPDQHPSASQIPLDKLMELLDKITRACAPTILVLDGIDECGDPMQVESFVKGISQMAKQNTPIVKLILTSRTMGSLESLLGCDSSILLEPAHTMNDILTFSSIKLEDDFRISGFKKHNIARTVTEKSQGLFIWASLFFQGISQIGGHVDVEIHLQRSKAQIASFYMDILDGLEGSSPELASYRNLIFKICCASVSPLSVSEATEVIGFLKGAQRLQDFQTLCSSACGPLIQLTNGKVSFSHCSVRDFLLEAGNGRDEAPALILLTEAHMFFASLCLKYLLAYIEDSTSSPDSSRVGYFPFLKYACLNWLFHITHIETLSRDLSKDLNVFIHSRAGTIWAAVLYPYFQQGKGESVSSAFSLLQSQLLHLNASLPSMSEPATISLLEEASHGLKIFLIRAFENAVSMKSHSEPTSRDTIEAILNLSRAYQTNRRFSQAKRTADRALALSTLHLGPKDPLSLTCHHQSLLLQLNHDKTKSKSHLATIISDLADLHQELVRVLGRFHMDTLRCHHDVGLALLYDRQLAEAYTILPQLYRDMKEHLGDSKLTQRAANNTANLLFRMKRLEDAKYLLEESDDVQQLAQFEQPVELSRYHIYCFEALESLAVIHHTNKESSVAIPLHERAIQGRLHLVGYDADAIIWARNLGYSLEHQQLYKKAFEHYTMWIHTAEQIPELVPLGKMLKRCQDECLRDWRNAYSRGRTLHLPPETNDMSVLYRAISNHSSLICGPLKWFRAWAMGFMIMTIALLMFSC